MKEEELDQLMHESFSDEDRKMLQSISQDPSVFEMIGDSFRGRNRWITVYATVWIIAFLVGAIWCGFRLADPETESVKEIVSWAAGLVGCVMVVGLLKIWFWLDMHRNALTREIKRLELAVASLKN